MALSDVVSANLDVFRKLLLYTFLMILLPLATFFITRGAAHALIRCLQRHPANVRACVMQPWFLERRAQRTQSRK
jgi:hypothetical protein